DPARADELCPHDPVGPIRPAQNPPDADRHVGEDDQRSEVEEPDHRSTALPSRSSSMRIVRAIGMPVSSAWTSNSPRRLPATRDPGIIVTSPLSTTRGAPSGIAERYVSQPGRIGSFG